MAGSIGRVAVVPSSSGPCNSNQDVAKAIVDKDVSDPYFLSAYFTSSVGIAACEREAAGAVQKHLYLYNIEQLPVPDPSCQVRLAIGNKLRVAENLRSRVRALTESALADVENLIDGKFDEAACLAEARKLAEEFGLEVP